MAIQPIATELRCKLCKHDRRPEIDALIEQRSRREINGDELLSKLVEVGVDNPNLDNVKNHLKKHCRIVDEAVAQAEERVIVELKAVAVAMFEETLGEGWRLRPIPPEALIDLQRRLYVHELELRVAEGLPSGVTHDHVLKGVAEQTKRKQEDAISELMRGVGRGVEAALSGTVRRHALPAPAIEGEVVSES